MSDHLQAIEKLRLAGLDAIASAANSEQLAHLRVQYLGRRSQLTATLRSIADLPADQRGPVGQGANQARKQIERELQQRLDLLSAQELSESIAGDKIDISLPGDPALPLGHHHLISSTRREIEDVFIGLGYRVAEGPEIERVYYNFDALNHAPNHPAREWSDTFYLDAETLLRTHTSPVQIRAMEAQPPPIYVIVPGKVYRRDNDATHTPMFHQIEGLAVDEDVTLADLKGTLLEFARAIFGEERDVRLRPHFFPFTEPSVEVDVSCFNCLGTGVLKDGSRDPLCKGIGWIEVLGAGMVDPNVLTHVQEHGYDPDRVQGFAFGMGIERIAMLRHGVPDLRLFYQNDLRFLEQF